MNSVRMIWSTTMSRTFDILCNDTEFVFNNIGFQEYGTNGVLGFWEVRVCVCVCVCFFWCGNERIVAVVPGAGEAFVFGNETRVMEFKIVRWLWSWPVFSHSWVARGRTHESRLLEAPLATRRRLLTAGGCLAESTERLTSHQVAVDDEDVTSHHKNRSIWWRLLSAASLGNVGRRG